MSVSTDFRNTPGGLHVRALNLGRWTLSLSWQYLGDMYGYKGSDGWDVSFKVIRNP